LAGGRRQWQLAGGSGSWQWQEAGASKQFTP